MQQEIAYLELMIERRELLDLHRELRKLKK